jgi:sugar phosphate permease
MAYEFVEAFSSVFPKIRITQIIAALGIVVDLVWRIWSGNFIHPSFVDVIAALLVGFYLGKRPKTVRSDENEKSRWIRLS